MIHGDAELSNEWETPTEVFASICDRFNISPYLDVCASDGMAKCRRFFTPKDNGLKQEWQETSWCNPPFSDIEPWLAKADEQHEKHGTEIIMIIPANAACAKYAQPYLEKDNGPKVHRHYGRIRFLQDGMPAESSSPNGMNIIVWRGK
jgi:phage N-6-adenine-methyltransferase